MDSAILEKLRRGCVIPAHPLALTEDGRIDVAHQRALTRYYLSAGAGGLAVGVHTTQFAIHDPKVGLLKPVLELAGDMAREQAGRPAPVMIAGIVGPTDQAVREAQMAVDLGYDVGLLSLTALKTSTVDDLIDHARQVAGVIPIMGFYLQPSISGMVLPAEFWRRLVEIPELVGIKIAPFNRYYTLDVLDAVAHSGRADEVALYTGNDDAIIHDLLTRYEFMVAGKAVSLRIVGGLLGHWACWTRRAVEYLEWVGDVCEDEQDVPPELLTLAAQVTLANRAIFDPDNNFTGCIPGILYVLQKQGLVRNIHTIDPEERLSPDQAKKIDEIINCYPHLTDDEFVRENLGDWLR